MPRAAPVTSATFCEEVVMGIPFRLFCISSMESGRLLFYCLRVTKGEMR